METVIQKFKESPNAGKGGEPTAAAPSAASSRPVLSNLTPDGVASLLTSAFAEPAAPKPADEGMPSAPAEGDETPPAPEVPGETPETPETPGAEPAEPENQLPEHLEAELAQWEQAGGTLPASLQKLVEKRIGKVVGEREAAEAKAAEALAEVDRLKSELQAQPAEARAIVGDEAQLTAKVAASKKFLKDARPFVGGYATEEQKTRVEKFMADNRMDENGLRQTMDEVSDWLTIEVPQQQQRIAQFKEAEASTQPFLAKRFTSLTQPNTAEAKLAQEILALVPELKSRTPAHGLAIGTYVLGKIAAEHLVAASPDGDVIQTLRALLAKHAPLPVKGMNGAATRPAALPGKAPARVPTGGSPVATPRVNARQVQEEQASQELRENPTAENVTKVLANAFR